MYTSKKNSLWFHKRMGSQCYKTKCMHRALYTYRLNSKKKCKKKKENKGINLRKYITYGILDYILQLWIRHGTQHVEQTERSGSLYLAQMVIVESD